MGKILGMISSSLVVIMESVITCLHTKLQELKGKLVYNHLFWPPSDPFGWNSIASIIFSAAPNPPIVTVTPLYDCGGLLEIESQATEGVGHDDQ